jgi:hypothetical protein
MFRDTSIFESKIHNLVSNMCFESIVSEAFIESLPINKSDLTDDLTHSLAVYATECVQDLGSMDLLKEAMESCKDPAKKAYLKRIYTTCMETATTVTARVIDEAGGDTDALTEAAKHVALTDEEYARFSKAAAPLTPNSLTEMIKKKTLDTIKEEKEAYQKDAELTEELKAALAEGEDDGEDADNAQQISTEPESDADIAADAPDNNNPEDENIPVENGNDDATGAEIGQSTESWAVAEEGIIGNLIKKFSKKQVPQADVVSGTKYLCAPEELWKNGDEDVNPIMLYFDGRIDAFDSIKMAILDAVKEYGSKMPRSDMESKPFSIATINLDTGVIAYSGAKPLPALGKENGINISLSGGSASATESETHFVITQNDATKEDEKDDEVGLRIKIGDSYVNLQNIAMKNEISHYKTGADIGQFRTGVDGPVEKSSKPASESATMTPANEGLISFVKRMFSKKKSSSNTDNAVKRTVSQGSTDLNAILAKLPVLEDEDMLAPMVMSFLDHIQKKYGFDDIQAFGIMGPNNVSSMFWRKQGEPKYDCDHNGFYACAVYNWVQQAINFGGSYKGVTGYHITWTDGHCSMDIVSTPIRDVNATMEDWMRKYIDPEVAEYNVQNHGDPSYESFTLRKNMNGSYAMESHFVDVQNQTNCQCPTYGSRIGQGPIEACKNCKKDEKKEKATFESFMRGMAGDNYRANHSSVFSRIQELTYEGLSASKESFTEIPFDTMTAITKQNTFSKFKSFGKQDLRQTLDNLNRYAFESMGTPDAPHGDGEHPHDDNHGEGHEEHREECLNNSLLVSSIIYTFFETLNSMNLYCPKLDEIRRFVDESLPVEAKVLKGQEEFAHLFKHMMHKAHEEVQHASTVPELDAVSKDLEMVRERASAPGLDSMESYVGQIDDLMKVIKTKRDRLVERQRPTVPAMESSFQTLQRTRDTLKFSRIASTMGRKPNVTMVKCKVDPQKNPKYVAIECFSANNKLANTATIVLEAALPEDVVGYVKGAIESSSLMDLDKRIVMTDLRSGKKYMDTCN